MSKLVALTAALLLIPCAAAAQTYPTYGYTTDSSAFIIPAATSAQSHMTECARVGPPDIQFTAQRQFRATTCLFNQAAAQASAVDGFIRGYQQGSEIRADRERRRAARAEQKTARDLEAQAKQAGTMIANGNCAGAEQYALAAGNFDLAERVKAYCAK